jgi:hypothetical protein
LRIRRVGLALPLTATLLFAPSLRASEPIDKVACARSYEQGQRLRRSHELRAAREELLSCARVECPAALRRECTQWAGEVEAATPTIVVGARNADGRPVTDLRIRIDGEPIGEQAGQAPIALDPGSHVVRFEASGAPAIEERVTLRE